MDATTSNKSKKLKFYELMSLARETNGSLERNRILVSSSGGPKPTNNFPLIPQQQASNNSDHGGYEPMDMETYAIGSLRGGRPGRGRGRGCRARFRGSFRSAGPQCYNCGGYDHISRNCAQGRPNPQCYRCGGFGHMAKNCATPASSSMYEIDFESYLLCPDLCDLDILPVNIVGASRFAAV
ncbi:unnamed protein product [Ambrosiozyma monospora]|uniref:Unnamed protein product n=1 Tax=Ambrosiozyma monospora TaxID=43982 RepID=A0ACB5T0C2_AMBMO|nr:unnamed protein product [Ambrosiozyma monospora]